jgi:RNA polymerase-interacting CarD/CdnL/TRCF family regulator
MDYKIGEKVVYPNHGVGIIEQISYGTLNGRTETYYMLRITSSSLKVMVPRSNAEAVGLRPVIRNGETSKRFWDISPRASSIPTTTGSTDSKKTQSACARAH